MTDWLLDRFGLMGEKWGNLSGTLLVPHRSWSSRATGLGESSEATSNPRSQRNGLQNR